MPCQVVTVKLHFILCEKEFGISLSSGSFWNFKHLWKFLYMLHIAAMIAPCLYEIAYRCIGIKFYYLRVRFFEEFNGQKVFTLWLFFSNYFIKNKHKNSKIKCNLFVKEQVLIVLICSAIAKGKLIKWYHTRQYN